MTAEGERQVSLLVVDDERMNRELLARRLRSSGYEVEVAENGEAALAWLETQTVDLVVLDIMMPGIDGLEVLRRVRAQHGATRLPVIMATAKDESQDVIRALKLGANDYVTKPVDLDVLQARIQTQVGLKQKTEALEAANARMQEELEAAAEIQKALLPQTLPTCEHVRAAWAYRPCEELAGDILNIFRLDAEHLGLYLLDVCGHGVPAALMSSALSHLLSPHPAEGTVLWERMNEPDGPYLVSPAHVAERLNVRFQPGTGFCQFFTMHYGILHIPTGSYRYVSAGHPCPMHLRRQGEGLFLAGGSPAIGIIEKTMFREHRIALEQGDRLVLYSDGILEALNEQGEEFSSSRMRDLLQAARGQTIDQVLSDVVSTVQQWTRGRPQDDISMAALELL